jgi:hypothetical protein
MPPTNAQPPLPAHLIATVSDVLADRFTHQELDTLFLEAGAPDDVPEGSKVVKCAAWLRRIRDENPADAVPILGKLLELVLDEDLPDPSGPATSSSVWRPSATMETLKERWHNRERLKAGLARAGLTYMGNGQFTHGGAQVASRQLADLIKARDLPAVEAEFETLARRAAEHPRDALSIAANIVEAVLGEMVRAFGLTPPSNRTLNTLWATVKPAINADPATMPDDDLKKIVGAMAAMVDGLQGLRDDKSRAHAMRPDLARAYRIEPRHARLAVNAALALTVFLLEAWQAREERNAGRSAPAP